MKRDGVKDIKGGHPLVATGSVPNILEARLTLLLSSATSIKHVQKKYERERERERERDERDLFTNLLTPW